MLPREFPSLFSMRDTTSQYLFFYALANVSWREAGSPERKLLRLVLPWLIYWCGVSSDSSTVEDSPQPILNNYNYKI